MANILTGQDHRRGRASYTFDVTVNGDVAVEPDEDFLVNVTNVANATVGDGQGTGTIVKQRHRRSGRLGRRRGDHRRQ